VASRRQPGAHHHLGWSLAVDVIRRTDKRHRRRNQCAPRCWPRWLLYVCVQITRPPSYAPAWRTASLRFSLFRGGDTGSPVSPNYERLPLLVAPRESLELRVLSLLTPPVLTTPPPSPPLGKPATLRQKSSNLPRWRPASRDGFCRHREVPRSLGDSS